MTRPMPKKPELADFFAELARTGVTVEDRAAKASSDRRSRRDRLDHANPPIPGEDREAIIADALRPTRALDVVRAWSGSVFRPEAGSGPPRPFLVLTGERGRGKTVACAWLAANVLSRFTTGPDLTQLRVRARFDSRAAEELVQIQAAKILILDDLCRDEHPAKEEEDVVFSLVHGRQRHGHFTLVTTNRSAQEIRARCGDYVADRLEHQGLNVRLTGPNLRRVADPPERPPDPPPMPN